MESKTEREKGKQKGKKENKKRKQENIKIYTKMSGKVNVPRLVSKNMTKWLRESLLGLQ